MPTETNAAEVKKILLIDDEISLLKMTSRMIEKMGHSVLAANTAADAMHFARSFGGNIDLMITDIVMPEVNGKVLAEMIAGIVPSIRCLYMSGYPADVFGAEGVSIRPACFLEKPFTKEGLEQKIKGIMHPKGDLTIDLDTGRKTRSDTCSTPCSRRWEI